MAFSTDILVRYTGPQTAYRPSNDEWNAVKAAVAKLATSSSVSTFFGSVSVVNVVSDKSNPNGDPNGAYWATVDSTMRLGSSIVSATTSSSVRFDSVDGTDKVLLFDRIVFHELVHAKYGDPAGASWQVAMYNDERAVFLENALYTASFGGSERVGHTGGIGSSPLTGVSASTVSYLGGFSLQSDGANGVFRFNSGSNYVTKEYKPHGSTVTATSTHSYDHYISITVERSSAIIDSAGVITSGTVNAVLPNSVGHDFATQVARAKAATTSVAPFLAALNAAGYAPSGLAVLALDQKIAKSISAERYFDQYTLGGITTTRDYAGPAVVNGQATPAALAIDASTLNNVIVFGASGYSRLRVDATSSYDDLRGGTGNDLLLAGGGTAAHENVLSGGGGNDVLVGRGNVDRLIGGGGNDVFVGGAGGDFFDGGSGFDIASYINATAAVKVDLSKAASSTDLGPVVGFSATSAAGDATGDHMSSVEGVIGSNHDDILVGGGFGAFLFGGMGNDQLHGDGADKVFGGEGNDIIYSLNGVPKLYGGNGDDVFVVGLSSNPLLFIQDIYGQSGVDIYWFERTSVDWVEGSSVDCTVFVYDPELGEKVFWNGYELSGGYLCNIDAEQEGNTSTYIPGYVGLYGERYQWYSEFPTQLIISLPDGLRVIVEGYSNGEMGLNLTGGTWGSGEDLPSLYSNICWNETFGDYQNLTGWTLNSGPHILSEFVGP